jgi:SAM-dependent methyltransferase
LLDVGCGAQPYRGLVPKEVRYSGIDTADAQQNFGYQVADTTYFQGDAWPLADASVQNVLATETLEHVSRPERFLAEARRCLLPNGTLILTVPFSARWHFIPHDYWRFTPSGLRQVLTDAGFRPVGVYARGNELTVACYKSLTLLLTWLFGVSGLSVGNLLRRAVALALSPLILLLAGVGQLSLRSRGGDDYLGYTVVSTKSDACAEEVL